MFDPVICEQLFLQLFLRHYIFTAKVLPGETPFPKDPILSAADAANKARSVADPCKIVHKNT